MCFACDSRKREMVVSAKITTVLNMTFPDVFVPKRCGVRFLPPALVLVYESNTDIDKVRKRIMPLRNFTVNSRVNYVTQDMKLRHSVLETVPSVKIEKMLRLLQEYLKGNTIKKSLEIVDKEYEINPEEDLNKLDTEEIQRKKEIMDETFNKNRIKPEDPNFVYDKRVNFDDGSTKVESNWDNEESDEFWK